MRKSSGIELVERKGGERWKVRYRDAHGKRRAKSFLRPQDAEAFKAQVMLAARSGSLASLDAGRQSVADLAAEWWETYAKAQLQNATLRTYSVCWNKHLLPRVGNLEVRAVTPGVVQRLVVDLAADEVGDSMARSSLVVLQGMFTFAVLEGYVASNPVQYVRKPSSNRARAVEPLAPARVEALRAAFKADNRLGGATIVSVLAYAGLRPQELLALRWDDVRERTILVAAKNVNGTIERNLKHRSHRARSVELIAPLAADLAEWRFASGQPVGTELVFARDGGLPWRDLDWRNYRKRPYRRASVEASLPAGHRPYDLRHSYASMLIHSGRSIVEVAAALGHSPAMTLRTYAHVIAEAPESRVTLEAVVNRARAA